MEVVRAFFLCLLSLSEFLVCFELGSSLIYCVAPGHMVSNKVRPLLMFEVVGDFFRLSLKCFFGAPFSQWPVESLPYKTIFGRPWSSILET